MLTCHSRLLLPRLLSRTFSTPSPTPKRSTTPLKTATKNLFEEHDLDNLVHHFKNLSKEYRFRCKHRIYEFAVRRLASANRFESIEEILEEQKMYKECSNEGFVIRLISLYGKSGMLDQALNTFHQMPELKCERTIKSLNALLNACVDSKRFQKVSELFNELPESLSVNPDVFSYNIVIRAFCEMGSLDSAISMLEEMEKNGVKPNLISFNTLLNGFYSRNRFVDGEKIWVLMERSGFDPDTASFNAKIRWFVSERKTMEAVKLLKELRSRRLKPDIFSFNALIKGFCNDGNLNEVKKIYGDLAKNDCRPNRPTYETIIPFLCERKEFDLAFQVCKDSMSRRCFVNIEILQGLVDGLVKNSKIKEAKRIVELGLSDGLSGANLKLPDEAT